MIRNATIEDIEKLVNLKTRVGRDTYFDYGTPEQFDRWVSEVCSPEYFEELLNNSTTVIVAEYQEVFLGMSAVSFYDDRALFGNLYIGLQDRGLGSLLTRHRMTLVDSHVSLMSPFSTYDVEARVFYQNHRAYKHLLKHGFLPVDWKIHEQYDFPLVIMKQTLQNNSIVYT